MQQSNDKGLQKCFSVLACVRSDTKKPQSWVNRNNLTVKHGVDLPNVDHLYGWNITLKKGNI